MQNHAILASLALACSLVAQAPSAISPQGAGDPTQLGNSNNNIPFSWTPTSYQQIHDASSFTARGAQVWTKMRQRMASGFTNYAGRQIDVEFFLAIASVNAGAASSVFASNILPSSEVAVFTRKQVNLPQVPSNDWAVAPYVFDVPFVWTMTNVSLRVNVYANSNGNAIFTYPLDAWSGTTTGSAVDNGAFAGCKHNLGSTPASLKAKIGSPGGNAVFDGNAGYAKAMPAYLTLGASDSTWGSLSLPVDLTPFNAPGCSIVNDILAVLSGTTDASGIVQWNVPIPASTSLDGQHFFTQIAIVDAAANGLGGYLSNGTRNILGGKLGITRIWGGISSTGGTLGYNYGMAISFN